MVGGPLKKVTQQWLKHALDDLHTAQFLWNARKYLYVGFMCQQSIEKYLKAIICQEMGITPPRTHNLISLADLIDARIEDAQRALLVLLTEYYLNNRYPDVKVSLSEKTTRPVAKRIIKQTEEFVRWLDEQYQIPKL